MLSIRVDLALEILKIFLERKAIFKKILKFIKEKARTVKDLNAKELLKKKIFLIDPVFFVILVKNNLLFD
tara:strand:- start:546 stop:755 length:210 start_codon:yes stop_codon:yes gene_type:complete